MYRGNVFGIEVEMEGSGFLKGSSHIRSYWNIERDSSLRGDSFEFVSNPLELQEIAPALAHLRNAVFSSRVYCSGRAGVHLHMNMQDVRTPRRRRTYLGLNILYPYLQSLLTDDRKENHYSIFSTREVSRVYGGAFNSSDNLGEKYSFVNALPLRTHGTLEIRGLPSTLSTPYILEFSSIAAKVKALSSESNIEKFTQDVIDLAPEEYREHCNRVLTEIELFQQGVSL